MNIYFHPISQKNRFYDHLSTFRLDSLTVLIHARSGYLTSGVEKTT